MNKMNVKSDNKMIVTRRIARTESKKRRFSSEFLGFYHKSAMKSESRRRDVRKEKRFDGHSIHCATPWPLGLQCRFLDASSHLYIRLRMSVRPSRVCKKRP